MVWYIYIWTDTVAARGISRFFMRRTTADTKAPATKKWCPAGNKTVAYRTDDAVFSKVCNISKERRIGNKHRGFT